MIVRAMAERKCSALTSHTARDMNWDRSYGYSVSQFCVLAQAIIFQYEAMNEHKDAYKACAKELRNHEKEARSQYITSNSFNAFVSRHDTGHDIASP